MEKAELGRLKREMEGSEAAYRGEVVTRTTSPSYEPVGLLIHPCGLSALWWERRGVGRGGWMRSMVAAGRGRRGMEEDASGLGEEERAKHLDGGG